jgi:hypothetical protein
MRETWDGTYTFQDLLEAHDLLDFKEENEARVAESRHRETE